MHTASIMSTSIFMEQSAVEDDYSALQQPIPVVPMLIVNMKAVRYKDYWKWY